MPILVGLDGERKMSKSLRNYVGIAETPGEMFGKLMSISDDLMWSYYELLTDFASPVIVRLQEEVRTGVLHPKKAKTELAHVVVAQFHGEEAARKAADEWDRIYSKRQLPSEMKEYAVEGGKMKLSRLMDRLGLSKSKAEAERLIEQGAVEWDSQKITDPAFTINVDEPSDHILRVGKKPSVMVRIGS
jgi:tyrosyl-tRNA synthetase